MAKAGPGELLSFLKTRTAGDIVSEHDILLGVPSWKKITLDTYRKKHKLDRFLAPMNGGRFRVAQDGQLLTEAEINAALSQVSPRAATLARNDRLKGSAGVYTLIREIGSGAVGVVWEAANSDGSSHVAVKVCSPRPDLLDPSVLGNVQDRFRREARLSPRVSHESLIAYQDAGEHLGASFLVMELAQSCLRDRLTATGPLSIAEVCTVGRRVVTALRNLHSQNCVHRDIKPSNILVTARGYVVGDLGIVRWGDLNRSFTGAGTITKSAVQLGSFNYMPLEQMEDAHSASPASDIYALGVTCIELLTGTVPIPLRVAAGQVDPPSEERLLNDLLARMTNYKSAERPSLNDIEDVLKIVHSRHATSGHEATL